MSIKDYDLTSMEETRGRHQLISQVGYLCAASSANTKQVFNERCRDNRVDSQAARTALVRISSSIVR